MPDRSREPPWQRPAGWLRGLAEIGALPTDSEELRLRKTVLVLSSTLIACLAFVWVATFAALGLWLSAAIPFAYQVASTVGLIVFARTRRYMWFRRSQLWLCLALPFALQWSLGGFRNFSAVCLWAFTSPLGALLFVGTRQAVPWIAAFAGLVALSGAIDSSLAAGAPDIPDGIPDGFFGGPDDVGFEVYSIHRPGGIERALERAGLGFGTKGSAPRAFYKLAHPIMHPPLPIRSNHPR